MRKKKKKKKMMMMMMMMILGPETACQRVTCELEHYQRGESNRDKAYTFIYAQIYATSLIFPRNNLR
jgi:hypothetical protein